MQKSEIAMDCLHRTWSDSLVVLWGWVSHIPWTIFSSKVAEVVWRQTPLKGTWIDSIFQTRSGIQWGIWRQVTHMNGLNYILPAVLGNLTYNISKESMQHHHSKEVNHRTQWAMSRIGLWRKAVKTPSTGADGKMGDLMAMQWIYSWRYDGGSMGCGMSWGYNCDWTLYIEELMGYKKWGYTKM